MELMELLRDFSWRIAVYTDCVLQSTESLVSNQQMKIPFYLKKNPKKALNLGS